LAKYENLTDRQKKIFDLYVESRSIDAVAKAMDVSNGDIWRTYQSDKFQLALTEYNKALVDKVSYTEAVIIDELWKNYNAEGVGMKDKITILTLLGKHIGMWSNAVQEKDQKASIQYNIVNYNGISSEIEKNKDAIEAQVIEETDDVPEGIQLLTYGTV
jgi:predicted DNA-binding protein YlxM (UPF0122 family)